MSPKVTVAFHFTFSNSLILCEQSILMHINEGDGKPALSTTTQASFFFWILHFLVILNVIISLLPDFYCRNSTPLPHLSKRACLYLEKKIDPICRRQKRSRSCSFMLWLSGLDKLTCWRVGAGTSFFMNFFYVPSPLPCHTQCYYFSPSRFLLPYFNTTTTSVEDALSKFRQ